MSRGLGRWQRAIQEALEQAQWVTLRGGSRSETVAIVRAARALERAGKCVLVRLWNDDHTAVKLNAFRPGFTLKGQPIEALSVERVPVGTGSTFKGSCRWIAREEGVSKSQISRDARRAGV
jgi:hypothetical protein